MDTTRRVITSCVSLRASSRASSPSRARISVERRDRSSSLHSRRRSSIRGSFWIGNRRRGPTPHRRMRHQKTTTIITTTTIIITTTTWMIPLLYPTLRIIWTRARRIGVDGTTRARPSNSSQSPPKSPPNARVGPVGRLNPPRRSTSSLRDGVRIRVVCRSTSWMRKQLTVVTADTQTKED